MAQDFEPEGPRPDRPLDDDAADFLVEGAPPRPIAVPPTHAPPPHSQPAEPPGHSPFPIFMSVLMAGTLIGAWIISNQKEPAAAAPTADAKPAEPADKDKAATAEAPAPAPTPADDSKALKGEVEALAKRIDGLQSKIDGIKSAPAPDLKPLHDKVDELAKVPNMVAPLPKKLDDLDGRIGSITKELDGLKADVASLKKGPEMAAAAPAPAPKPEDVDGADEAMGQAVDLFKGRKFKEAADAFRKLSEDKGNDARVWYYAALANGLATRNWTGGDTVQFVTKGIEREKAGSPPTDKIDAVFNDLTKQNGKDWLAGYRQRAKR